MRIEEAARRLWGGYWWLLVLCVTLPAAGAAAYAVHQPPRYEAVSRIQMSGGLAASNVEADAATQWLQGVVTSPGLVQAAMNAAGVKGDPTAFAKDAISVQRIGVSSVNDVLVSTADRAQSQAIASALVAAATRYSNRVRDTDLERMSALTQQINRLTAEQGRLIKELSTAAPGTVLELQARISSSQPALADLLRQRADLETVAAGRSSIGVLDPPRLAADPVVLSPAQLGALGALAGLLVGLGIAAFVEMVRPRVRGAGWVAEALGAPLLATLPRRPFAHPVTRRAVHDLGAELSLAMRGHPRGQVLLLPVEARDGDRAIALGAELRRSTRLPVVTGLDELTGLDGDQGLSPDGAAELAVVAVVAAVVNRRRLEAFASRAAALGCPLLGVVVVRRRVRRGWSLRRAAAEAGAGQVAEAKQSGARSPVAVQDLDLNPAVPHVIQPSERRQLNGSPGGRVGIVTRPRTGEP
ncbi:MAG TPA: hypothetical protein VFL38_00165 [Humibacillus xanthopallidus]|nr:hypothetical protein [Humibacillus xanthopallidus]